jgi:hypothetical protein
LQRPEAVYVAAQTHAGARAKIALDLTAKRHKRAANDLRRSLRAIVGGAAVMLGHLSGINYQGFSLELQKLPR